MTNDADLDENINVFPTSVYICRKIYDSIDRDTKMNKEKWIFDSNIYIYNDTKNQKELSVYYQQMKFLSIHFSPQKRQDRKLLDAK